MKNILANLKKSKGKVGFYYKNLITKEEISFNENETFMAASVIKLPILAAVFSEVAKINPIARLYLVGSCKRPC